MSYLKLSVIIDMLTQFQDGLGCLNRFYFAYALQILREYALKYGGSRSVARTLNRLFLKGQYGG
jgi:hypothetical protein